MEVHGVSWLRSATHCAGGGVEKCRGERSNFVIDAQDPLQECPFKASPKYTVVVDVGWWVVLLRWMRNCRGMRVDTCVIVGSRDGLCKDLCLDSVTAARAVGIEGVKT